MTWPPLLSALMERGPSHTRRRAYEHGSVHDVGVERSRVAAAGRLG